MQQQTPAFPALPTYAPPAAPTTPTQQPTAKTPDPTTPTAAPTENLTAATTKKPLPGPSTTTAIPLASLPITRFVPDPSCIGRYWILSHSDTSTIWSGSPDRLYSSCMPPSTNNYSPSVCPAPMTVWDVNNFVGDTYTEVCCQRNITSSTQVLDGLSVESKDVFTGVSTGTASHSPFIVLWADRDLSLFPSDVSASRKSIESFGFQRPTATASAGGDNTVQASDHATTSLSSGAIAGIVIGVAFAIILATLIMWFVLRKRSRKVPGNGHAPELDAVHTATWKRWYRGAWRAELDSRNARSELDSRNVRAELDTRNVRAKLDSGNVAGKQVSELDNGNARKEQPAELSEVTDTTSNVQQT
ncbi:hypothetical protein PG997_002723 [Apiospora hydei]|uniref:Uncharacterized protein n=1 Tax=Apiospora hydei TaxID=1337664 RepID=A0ABR1WX91_9PEZI